jgi:exopolyphosphatase/guanosine-5'-triphosphate,3'-diphosphate pyrophosphatase
MDETREPAEAASRLAVIDLGSNSFRLVVFASHGPGEDGVGWWRRVDEIYQPVRIAEGMAATGRLGVEPMARALTALDAFAHYCRATGLGPGEIDAVATSAIREARNQSELLAQARARSGLPIRVLSEEEEARYGYLAAVNSTTLADGHVIDLGGGSLQLVRVRGREEREWGSWPLGTVRMTERFMPGRDPLDLAELEPLREHVRATLHAAPWLGGGDRVVGVGGTLRNLATALQRAARLPDPSVQGAVIERAALAELVGRLAALGVEQRARLPGIKPARADVILAGAVIAEAVLELTGAPQIEVTEAGLREGIFLARHLAGRRPPLLEDVRGASVLNLAARYGAAGAHSRHVAALALSMFDQLAAIGLHRGDPDERELLWAASMLHDVGMSVDYDDHHKHSRYLILHGGLPGFSPREVALIAQAVRYHRKDMPSPGPLRGHFRKGDRRRLERCVALLRLAEDLERARDQLVRSAAFSRENGSVALRLRGEGASALPRWAAAREGELFARAFGCELVVA